MPSIALADLDRMRSNLLFDGDGRGAKSSRFWVLLVLSACIASAGVLADSTATVIGAMIVAPLMTPIMGAVLSITTSDRANVVWSGALIVAGACLAIAVGFLFGLITPVDIDADTSSQVASRINPRLIDLIAAIATGAVGAFAQCREDISDTLPGVAIAISLVPPLTVVGLTLEAGELIQARGALLLFLTNVAAILLSGVVVMTIFGVHTTSLDRPGPTLEHRRAFVLIVAIVAAIAVPLGVATVSFTRETIRNSRVADVARDWSGDAGWSMVSVSQDDGATDVYATGALPFPDEEELRAALDAAGLDQVDVQLHLVPQEQIDLPGR